VAKKHKQAETEVVKYLWPDHPCDETGSIRDWKELHDASGPGRGDLTTYFLEIKSQRLPPNLKAMRRVLASALDQLRHARSVTSPKNMGIEHLVVVWRPTGLRGIENALAYWEEDSHPVMQFLSDFRSRYIEGYDMERWIDKYWTTRE